MTITRNLTQPLTRAITRVITQAGAGGWTPALWFLASEQGIWLDPSDLGTMSQTWDGSLGNVAVGDPVGRIEDKSGNGNHATQSTSAKRPILRQSGGLYYLEFDGVDDFLVSGNIDFTGTDAMTVIAGIRKNTDAGGVRDVVGLSSAAYTTNGTFLMTAPAFSAPSLAYNSRGTSGSANNINNATYAAPWTGVFTGQSDISADQLIGRANGVQVFTSATDQGTGNYANDALYVGARGGTALFYFGHLYQLIARGAATADLAPGESFVAAKTGVVL